jgi:hypothetical protein
MTTGREHASGELAAPVSTPSSMQADAGREGEELTTS